MGWQRFSLVALSMGLVACGGAFSTDLFPQQGDESPTQEPPVETPTPTPQSLFFDESYISVQCDSSTWQIDVVVDGWTDIDSAEFGFFDPTTYCESYGQPPEDCYREWHALPVIGSYTSDGYYEELALSLDEVDALDQQVDGISTIFQCTNEDLLTFAVCATDFFYATGELCVFFGNEADYWGANARMCHQGGDVWGARF